MPITYSQTLTKYSVGRRANMEEWNTITRTNSAATAIAFGVPVMPGTTAHSCIVVDATTGRNVLGITEASLVQSHVGDNHAQYDNVPICTMGVIGVLLGANVTEGAQARFNTANSTWTGAAQSATVVTIPGAQFDEAGSSGAVGIIRYVRPVTSLSVSG